MTGKPAVSELGIDLADVQWKGSGQGPGTIQVLRVIEDEHGGVTGNEHVLALKSPARRSRSGLGVQGVAGMLSLSR
jgi:hypothetical protein